MKKKLFAIIFVLLFVLLPISVNADMGPKPSVRIVIEGLGDEVCYGTLLSQTDYTVGASVWDGTEEDARHSGNSEWYDTPEDIWRAFVEYKDADGFYYLQETWNCGETGTLDWTYIPPNIFKVLLDAFYDRYSLNLEAKAFAKKLCITLCSAARAKARHCDNIDAFFIEPKLFKCRVGN
jgi:hypothetical protein